METLDYTQYAVRNFSEVENLMTSVERVITYTNLESDQDIVPGYLYLGYVPGYMYLGTNSQKKWHTQEYFWARDDQKMIKS